MCEYVRVCVHVCVCVCPLKPEKGDESPGAGVPCQTLMLGTGLGYSTRAVTALNPRTTSPALLSIVTEISSAVFIQLFVFLFYIMFISHSRATYTLKTLQNLFLTDIQLLNSFTSANNLLM